MKIQEYLKTKKIICDGAFGTYFSQLYGEARLPECYNLSQPERIQQVHQGYLEAGAVLIRTNTFASGRRALGCDREGLFQNLQAGWENAVKAVEACGKRQGEDCFIAGDVGPLLDSIGMTAEERQEEYLLISEGLVKAGADILLFETFMDMEDILPAIQKIKQERELFIIVQFCVNQYGHSNAGISVRRLMEEAGRVPEIDAVGFNCGVGPGHLQKLLEGMDFPNDKFITALPNAGYPKYVGNRKVFSNSKEYFADKMQQIAALGVDFIGGCCGTNPEYVKEMCHRIDVCAGGERRAVPMRAVPKGVRLKDSSFWGKKEKGRKLIAVELSPPPGIDDEKVMEAAFRLQSMEVDVLTFPDSPSGRTRADSLLMAMKVQQETGLCVMPHICCRDRNAIAMRSQLLGGYINGVRNILAITGDPVPTLMRQDIKSVFNFDAVGLMKIIQELNREELAKDPITFGGALNPGRPNLEVEIKRTRRKMEHGAEFFLTQPIFTLEDADRVRRIKEETGARILCGIMPLVSLRNALFIKNEMVGIHVDDETIARFSPEMSKEEGELEGVAIAKQVMEMTKDFVDGYYFSIPFNRVRLLEKIL
ncbi:MAG: bifunctional homocysteine S-methyltransferase/methylenetetrahydrofolate reductase [Lachnospiraceae bacterium]|nr:bifunctional homocysteine S-methyltransferase/methylenetetrahydrofolate reductase [Lachnospiraceae bacterium]